MNNTEKKLDALIDALGFDVEETMTGDHRTFGCWIDFKFTKRDEPVRDWSVTGNDLIGSLDVLYNDVSLRQLVKNVNQLSDLDKKYRWIKYPRDSYNAVFGYFNGRMIVWSCANSFDVLGVKVMLDE
jgi:hypothetical protein